MSVLPQPLGAITLFVADLQRAHQFYRDVFGRQVVYQDAQSAVFDFGSILINLLENDAARIFVDPEPIGPRDAGARFALSIWVEDVDAICLELRRLGVGLLAGPLDRDWGKRTANFADPDGHLWEIAQAIPAAATD
ncbi:MAG: VOC family protein [Nakamurella sp.]